MSKVIREYYEKAHTMPALIEQKIALFEKHPDIMREFENWITTKQFSSEGVNVEGYTAAKLAEKFRFLRGEGAFVLLIELRDNSQKAHKRISGGFKRK